MVIPAIGSSLGAPPERRVWHPILHSAPAVPEEYSGEINEILPKPDFVALGFGLQPNAHLRWNHIDVIGQVKGEPEINFEEDILMDQLKMVYCLLGYEENRRFVIPILFHKFALYLSYFGRSGIIHCSPFSIEDNDGIATFLQLIIGITFGQPEAVGIDPTVEIDPVTGKAQWVRHCDEIYKVIATECLPREVVGRGTMVWRVVDSQGRPFVIKSSWPARSRLP